MPIALHQLPDDIDALKSLLADQAKKLDQFVVRNEQLATENQRYKVQVLTLTEQLNLALARRYAASSEKLSPDQICLFDEAELEGETESDIDALADNEKKIAEAKVRDDALAAEQAGADAPTPPEAASPPSGPNHPELEAAEPSPVSAPESESESTPPVPMVR